MKWGSPSPRCACTARGRAAWQRSTSSFIKGTNANHKPYLSHLRNSYLDGLDVYPNTVQEAYNILQRREELHNVPTVEGDGIAFAQKGGWDMSMVTCYSCHQTGQNANSEECPNYKGVRSGRKESDGPPRGRRSKHSDVKFLPGQRRNPEDLGAAGQSVYSRHLLQPKLVSEHPAVI